MNKPSELESTKNSIAAANDGKRLQTRSSLRESFERLSLKKGDTVLVHSSLSRIGWVCGGAVAVVEALLDVIGSEGTLMVPTHTSDNTDPALWQCPPVPESWWEVIRKESPAFDPDKTPSARMGAIPEIVRKWTGAKRSEHPIVSFAALGPNADYLLGNHHLEADLGEDCPTARLYELNGLVLLLGVGHERNTSLHLAEYRAAFPGKKYYTEGTAMIVEGKRHWKHFPRLQVNSDDFEKIGEAVRNEKIGFVGEDSTIAAQLFHQPSLVDFAVRWMNSNR